MAKVILICSGCLGEFTPKDIFIASKSGMGYSTHYCGDCIEELGITELKPYLKPRKSRKKKTD